MANDRGTDNACSQVPRDQNLLSCTVIRLDQKEQLLALRCEFAHLLQGTSEPLRALKSGSDGEHAPAYFK